MTVERPLRTVAEVAEWLGMEPDELRSLKKRGRTRPLLTVTEAARELGIHRSTIYKMMERGELDFRYVNHHRRIRRADLDLYVERAS